MPSTSVTSVSTDREKFINANGRVSATELLDVKDNFIQESEGTDLTRKSALSTRMVGTITGGEVRYIKNTKIQGNEPEPSTVDAAESTADNRMVLLARKYAEKDFSREEAARLEILTHKLRRLVPRVSYADFEKLESIAVYCQTVEKENEELERLLSD